MKKILFWGLILFPLFAAWAQASCNTALNLPLGTTVVSEITGSYTDNCWQPDAADAANWYKYTATANGYLTLNTNLSANDGESYSDDTRISVYQGSCESLECWAYGDDIDVPGQNYRTNLEFLVISGQTYYIAFDNQWLSMGFMVEASFTEVSCFPVTSGFEFVDTPLPTQVTIKWDAPLVAPSAYEFRYGNLNFDPLTTGNLISNISGSQVTLSDLMPDTDYEFYVKSVCDNNIPSEWTGPVRFSTPPLPANIPYAFGFEADQGRGWTAFDAALGAIWVVQQSTTELPAKSGSAFAKVGSGGIASDAWLFSRGLNLTGGTSYTLVFDLVKYIMQGDGNINNLTVTFGTAPTVEGQTNIITDLPNYTSQGYEQQINDFVPSVTGVYYIGFRYTAPAHTQSSYGILGLDDVSISLDLGMNELLGSKLIVSPNPTSGIVNVVSNENILINDIVVSDINGRAVNTLKFDPVSNVQLNISDLSAGVYMMTISSDNGVVTKKIIKN